MRLDLTLCQIVKRNGILESHVPGLVVWWKATFVAAFAEPEAV